MNNSDTEILGNDIDTLMDLTGQESGILIYGENGVIVTNWCNYDKNRMPLLSPFGVLMPWPEEEGVFHGAQRRFAQDIRTEIPGSVWLTDETKDDGTRIADTDLDIVSDENNDIIRLFLDDLTADDYEGYIYTLRDGRKIIAPSTWN